MDKYKVKVNPRAIRDLDNIYEYIASEKLAPENAKGQVERIKKSILGLDTFPQSHQERNEGRYAGKGYRQLIIDNYIVIFRISEPQKTVYVVTIQYQGRNLYDKKEIMANNHKYITPEGTFKIFSDIYKLSLFFCRYN